jgi:hypothetical protein
MSGRGRARAVLIVLVLVGVGVFPSASQAAFGDGFGFAAINDGAGSAPEVPALPGATHVFWAGTCDLASAPGLGQPIDGGVGNYASTVWAPDWAYGFAPFQSAVVAPPTPAHCIDRGGPQGDNVAGGIWRDSPAGGEIEGAPSWRLAASTQASAHPDGTAGFSFAHLGGGASFGIDGSVDNISVDLPPGFVGDPTAVPKCTAEQFTVKPLQCPVQTQVGVLNLEIDAVFGTNNLSSSSNEQVYPVFNLEPRRGNVAELGFGYASGEDAVIVRIVAKARTNKDFGVTTFVGQIPAALPVRSQQITLWGVPWAAANDRWRAPLGLTPREASPGACRYQPGLPSEFLGGVNNYYIPPAGFTVGGCAQSYEPSWGPVKPFISNLTECTGGDLSTRVAVDSYQNPGAYSPEGDPVLPDPINNTLPGWKVYDSPAPAVTGCDKVPFDADIDLHPTTQSADSPSGLSVDLSVPQNDDLPFGPPADDAAEPEVDQYVSEATAHWKSDEGLATSHLDKAVVTLPEGFSVNPSAASGLDGCSDSEIGLRAQGNPPLFNNGDPFDSDPSDGAECPQGSIIGDVEVDVPLLEEPLEGNVVLGDPKSTDPVSGQMFRMFIVIKDDERGLIAKIYGSAVADPATGKLTATFERNPRVPFEDMHIEFKQGGRGILATPQKCASHGWSSVFTPWTAAHSAGGQSVPVDGAMATSQNCANTFAPLLLSGMDTQTARSSGRFSFRFSRKDGEQYLRGLTATLPKGLLASVKDVPLCTNAQAGAGACPAGSKIGIVDAKAGAGTPFVLERKGEVFLTEGYKGGEYGLAVKIRPIAGPFRGSMELSPITVRQSIHVDRTTARVTAVSNPFPLIHHGVPLRVREVTVLVNRSGFMLNPSDCTAKQVTARISSDQGAAANRSNSFQAASCAALPFKPTLGLQLTGRKQIRTGKHPGVKAVVKQAGIPEAGIRRAEVRLPKSLALDPDNAQALCEFEDGTKPDLENHCPKGSIIGRARAVSPLLNDPLVGDVYFVKNVKRSSTGNLIRTLPMIVVALRGEIAVNLKGTSDVKGGKLVNVFDEVPDAPISQFNLNIKGGGNGILAVTRTRRAKINLCASGRQIAEADMDGQNGRRHDFNVAMRKPCPRKAKAVCKTKRQKAGKACKAKAKRAKGGRRR